MKAYLKARFTKLAKEKKKYTIAEIMQDKNKVKDIEKYHKRLK